MVKKLSFSIFVFIVIFLAGYGISVVLRARPIWSFLRAGKWGWTNGLFRADKTVGYVPNESSSGERIVPFRSPIPVHFDARGFRVSTPDEMGIEHKPVVLFLGCSFTFGDGCAAEETFPFLVQSALNGTAYNAGVCGYGLGQIWERSKKLIPEVKPDFVVVQYSPWLIDRSCQFFAPTYHGLIPVNTFVDRPTGLELEPPSFRTIVFRLSFADYRRQNQRGFLSFLAHVAVPLFVHDDYYRLLTFRHRHQTAPLVQRASRSAIIALVYGDIARRARSAGAVPVLLKLGGDVPAEDEAALKALRGYLVVDGEGALRSALKGENYSAVYNNWLWGKLIDKHPNPAAHRIIADALIKALRSDRR